ncbi:hypothetical protein ACFL6U_07615 [Planctomycetota bacterium]
MISVHKVKIPSHLCFALKTSMVESALQGVGYTQAVDLNFIEPATTGDILEAQYRQPDDSHKEPYLFVSSRAVSVEIRPEIVALLKDKILLEFMIWLEQVLALPAHATLLKQQPTFHFAYNGGRVHLDHSFLS